MLKKLCTIKYTNDIFTWHMTPAIWHNQNVQIFQYQSGQLQSLKIFLSTIVIFSAYYQGPGWGGKKLGLYMCSFLMKILFTYSCETLYIFIQVESRPIG